MIAWFARNGVAANLMLVAIVVAGIFALKTRIPLEVFPSFELDSVSVGMVYRGATPAEVEEAVIQRIEEAVFDLEGIKEMSSTANEGNGSVVLELERGYDKRDFLDDVKNRVDRISTFPADVERPIYTVSEFQREVISVAIAGPLDEKQLRLLGERVRDDLTALPDISQVELTAVRAYEIGIEIPASTLEAYDLTLQQVATAISSSSLDLSAGEIRTDAGDVLVRTVGQAYEREDFESIVVVARPDGTRLTLADLAEVRDGFEEQTLTTRFNQQPAVLVDVYQVGTQNSITVADAVKAYIDDAQSWAPPGVEISYWRDRSKIVKGRLGTLLQSAMQGGLLIFILLTLFLRFSVAVWVCVGIPVCFMGALALLPMLGATINIVSLFGFILVLGIVVDDAIVTGENIYTHQLRHGDGLKAAIEGTKEVAVPVTFGVLTTAVAFLPILFLEGRRGQIFAQIPLVVIPVLLFSLIESKFILPAHLSHLKAEKKTGIGSYFRRVQRVIADGLEWIIQHIYQPILELALRWRYAVWSMFFAGTLIALAIVFSGGIRFVFFPTVQSELATVSLTMPSGTPFAVTDRHVQRIADEAFKLRDKYIDQKSGESVIQDIFVSIGSGGSSVQSNRGQIRLEIMPPEERTSAVTSSEIVGELRKAVGQVPGAQELSYRAEIGRGGSPLEVRLKGRSFDDMREVIAKLKVRLASYPEAFDITDSLSSGKQEMQLTLTPAAEQLGISDQDLAQQVRAAFFGVEAQRIQRGRDDVRVMVRYPESERQSLANLQNMKIRTADGRQVPFSVVANSSISRSVDSIQRIDRNRISSVSADVDKENADIEAIKADLSAYAAELVSAYPDMTADLEGEAREQADTFSSLYIGLAIVLLMIYGMLAIPFKSYLQPLIVMSIIPFGVVGAIIGHIILGMNLSILSVLGMLALVGVVVNDSLVLVDYVNRQRASGKSVFDAASSAGAARFRAVLLTSLTTFAGLMPLIFLEKSTQAQFLIPMAVSLGFGILFATAITLMLIPIHYLILDDIVRAFKYVYGSREPASQQRDINNPV